MATQYRHHPTAEIIAASAATKHFYGQIQLCGNILGRYGTLRIPDPILSIPDHGSRADKIPDLDPYQRVVSILNPKN
jgi:hypothetical protein